MTRPLLPLVVLLLLVPVVFSQGLGDAAARQRSERGRRERRAGTPARVYTNDDLPQGKEKPGTKEGARVEAPPPVTTFDRRDSEAGPDSRPDLNESEWRQRAAEARARVRGLEQKADELQKQISALLLDREPTLLGDPNRLQTLAARRQEAIEALERTKTELDAARQAFTALEEEARRKSVPPGWIEERS